LAVLVLNQEEVERLLDMEGCIDAMADALAALARGEVHVPLRFVVKPADEPSLIGLMPAHRAGNAPLYSLKTVCVFPDNPKRGLDAHQGTVTLFDGETGEVRALMNASAITAIRTAAVSAVATRLLAREDALELGALGAGVQARSQGRCSHTALRSPSQARDLPAFSQGTSAQAAMHSAGARGERRGCAESTGEASFDQASRRQNDRRKTLNERPIRPTIRAPSATLEKGVTRA
jgi:ornithine cyclodeaminase/alanine dehydrogenase-like protein (mu-crystallin family)